MTDEFGNEIYLVHWHSKQVPGYDQIDVGGGGRGATGHRHGGNERSRKEVNVVATWCHYDARQTLKKSRQILNVVSQPHMVWKTKKANIGEKERGRTRKATGIRTFGQIYRWWYHQNAKESNIHEIQYFWHHFSDQKNIIFATKHEISDAEVVQRRPHARVWSPWHDMRMGDWYVSCEWGSGWMRESLETRWITPETKSPKKREG